MSKKHKYKKKRFQSSPTTITTTEAPEISAPTPQIDEKLAQAITVSPETHASVQELRTIAMIMVLLLVIVTGVVITNSKTGYLNSLSTYLAHLVNIE